MNNYENDRNANELVTAEEEVLTVEVPTEIRAGRTSSDCYRCSTQCAVA